MNFTKAKNFLFENLQTIFLFLGLTLLDAGIFLTANAGFGLIGIGISLLVLAAIFNSEKNGGVKR